MSTSVTSTCTDKHNDNHDSMESIHQQVLERLLHQEQVQLTNLSTNWRLQQKHSILQSLKRKRIALYATVEEKRSNQFTSLQQELTLQRKRRKLLDDRPYLRLPVLSLQLPTEEAASTDTASAAANTVDQMHQLRLKRMLTA